MTQFPKIFEQIVEGIKTMEIRGAAEIARSAAEALLSVAESSKAETVAEFVNDLDQAARILLKTRPTAVSLPNSVRYIMKRVLDAKFSNLKIDELRNVTIDAARKFIENSKNAVKRIGEIGSKRIQDGDLLLTHCNSTAALSIILRAWEEGKQIKVFATETRPLFQGRTTAKILARAGIPVTLIVDSAVRYFMPKIDKVVVGADAIAANGAVVNKIGTSMVALAAHEARVLFFVAAETYKFSPETMFGELVLIEERNATEVVPSKILKTYRKITVRNPSFDVTPAEYVDLIVTERGIIPPQGAISILQSEFGWMSLEELHQYQTYAKLEEE
ncbi:ribose 1,5-bisphosphate isomerase [Candidatus Bathyarchaeota archaeon]|nr:ribose 1,5-bisphosphate isomerase [Candidatus Bathyarchaeota archaeon]